MLQVISYMEVASNPCAENKSSAASRISCFVLPFSAIMNFLNKNITDNISVRLVGCQTEMFHLQLISCCVTVTFRELVRF